MKLETVSYERKLLLAMGYKKAERALYNAAIGAECYAVPFSLDSTLAALRAYNAPQWLINHVRDWLDMDGHVYHSASLNIIP